MEYLPLPKEPALPRIEVAFRDAKKYWDNASWDEWRDGSYWNNFPKRFGYTRGEFWKGTGPNSNKAWANPSFATWLMQQSRKELDSIVIGWLFFGTLAEVTGCYLNIENYLKLTNGGGSVLIMTETSMNALIERWITLQTHFKGSRLVRGIPEPKAGIIIDEKISHPDLDDVRRIFCTPPSSQSRPKLNAKNKSPQFERAHSCLRKSKAIIGQLCQSLDTKIVFVIATLHEYLAEVLPKVFQGEVVKAYDIEGEYSLGRWAAGADFCHFNHDAVRQLRWCPRTAQSFWNDVTRTMAVDYFATNLKSYQSSEDHSSCTEKLCSAYQLDPDEYEVVHAPEKGIKCKCPHLGLPPRSSSEILDSGAGSFPLVTVSKSTGSTSKDLDSGIHALTVSHPAESETLVKARNAALVKNYVAISHVWSHGLGNPRKNTLPNCQLRRIQNFVTELASQHGFHEKPMPFWMDTLCCPLEPKEARRTAIMRMRITYERASFVLVLDQNVCSLSTVGLSKLELLMQIYRTTWMTRLWTLQEARCAKELWFQFMDKAVNLETLYSEFKAEHHNSVSKVLSNALFGSTLFKNLTRLREKGEGALSRLIILSASLEGRSTSWATDEAICICNIMDLDLAPILEYTTDDQDCASLRMAALWKQWGAVPPAIIFNQAPRLLEKGFKWAPSTFVRAATLGFPMLETNQICPVDPNGEGLMVSMQGFILDSNIPALIGKTGIGLEKIPDPKMEKGTGTEGLGSRMSCGLCEMSEEPFKWYDLEIVGPVHETKPEHNMKGSYAILFSDKINQTNIDLRQKPALLCSVRKTENGITYVTSLNHAKLARSESVVEKLFNAAQEVRKIMSTHGVTERPGSKISLSNFIPPKSIANIKSITATVLADPEVNAYMTATILKNRDEKYMKWLKESEERRNDWNFRASNGDVALFRESALETWVPLSSRVVALGKSQKWCVD